MIGDLRVNPLGDGTVAVHVHADTVELLKELDEAAPAFEAPDHGPVAAATEEVLAVDPLAALEAEQVGQQVRDAVAATTRRQDALAAALLSVTPAGDTVTAIMRVDQLPELAAWANRLSLRMRGQQVQVGQGQEAFADDDLAELLGAAPAPGPRMVLDLREMLMLAPSMLACDLLTVHRALTGG